MCLLMLALILLLYQYWVLILYSRMFPTVLNCKIFPMCNVKKEQILVFKVLPFHIGNIKSDCICNSRSINVSRQVFVRPYTLCWVSALRWNVIGCMWCLVKLQKNEGFKCQASNYTKLPWQSNISKYVIKCKFLSGIEVWKARTMVRVEMALCMHNVN